MDRVFLFFFFLFYFLGSRSDYPLVRIKRHVVVGGSDEKEK